MTSRWFPGGQGAAWIEPYLDHLQEQRGCVSRAADLTPIARSAVYRMREQSPDFAQLEQLAIQGKLTPEIKEGALNGGQQSPPENYFVLPNGDPADSIHLSVDGRVLTISADALAALACQMGGS